MPYPTPDEFKTILAEQPLEEIVRDHVFEGVPFAFKDRPVLMETLREHLVRRLNVAGEGVTVVGSGKLGFSLSPDGFPARFSAKSDIDVAVVDQGLYDQIWFAMLKWHYPRRTGRLPEQDHKWSTVRQRELYWGWFTPNRIRYDGLSFPAALRPLRDISTSWFNAFRSLSLYPQFADREISGRLYRTWDHAMLYHVDGLRQIRDSIRTEGES